MKISLFMLKYTYRSDVMKKKIFLFCLIALLFTGCSSNSSKVYDEIESSGYEVGWGGNPDGIVCNEIKDALYVDNNFFISNNGKVYKLNIIYILTTNLIFKMQVIFVLLNICK